MGGAILAAMNTASEYGFGAVIAALPGFGAVSPRGHSQSAVKRGDQRHGAGRDHRLGLRDEHRRRRCPRPVAAAHAANIPLEVLHRVAAMASGGMDTLPHNGR